MDFPRKLFPESHSSLMLRKAKTATIPRLESLVPWRKYCVAETHLTHRPEDCQLLFGQAAENDTQLIPPTLT